jgi:hypothetical protein
MHAHIVEAHAVTPLHARLTPCRARVIAVRAIAMHVHANGT